MAGGIVRLAMLFEGGLIVLALGLGWALKSPFYEEVVLRWQAVAWGVVATAPPLFIMWRFGLNFRDTSRILAALLL